MTYRGPTILAGGGYQAGLIKGSQRGSWLPDSASIHLRPRRIAVALTPCAALERRRAARLAPSRDIRHRARGIYQDRLTRPLRRLSCAAGPEEPSAARGPRLAKSYGSRPAFRSARRVIRSNSDGSASSSPQAAFTASATETSSGYLSRSRQLLAEIALTRPH